MEPTILQGQTVLVSSIPYLFSRPKIGDIVLIRHSGKRGTRASRISLSLDENERDSGVLWSSQSPQNDAGALYLVKRIFKIDGDKYFVKGDNERDSLDSRKIGWIGRREIVGRVV